MTTRGPWEAVSSRGLGRFAEPLGPASGARARRHSAARRLPKRVEIRRHAAHERSELQLGSCAIEEPCARRALGARTMARAGSAPRSFAAGRSEPAPRFLARATRLVRGGG